jgi:hypothetical protein
MATLTEGLRGGSSGASVQLTSGPSDLAWKLDTSLRLR